MKIEIYKCEWCDTELSDIKGVAKDNKAVGWCSKCNTTTWGDKYLEVNNDK